LEKRKIFKFPSGPQDLVDINTVVSRYSTDHTLYVLSAFCYLYILLL